MKTVCGYLECKGSGLDRVRVRCHAHACAGSYIVVNLDDAELFEVTPQDSFSYAREDSLCGLCVLRDGYHQHELRSVNGADVRWPMFHDKKRFVAWETDASIKGPHQHKRQSNRMTTYMVCAKLVAKVCGKPLAPRV